MPQKVCVYTGLPGTGKTSALIEQMRAQQDAGGKVVLMLPSHVELTRRPNVKPGGLMGCRKPGFSFEIDHVCTTPEAVEILESLKDGELAVFDEAQFFEPEIVSDWNKAAKRGVRVLVASPSQAQLQQLKSIVYDAKELEIECECKTAMATKVVYKTDMTYPTHLCSKCRDHYVKSEIDALLEDVKADKPFPGELHTYQPFYGVQMDDWKLVRGDSPARLDIIKDAISRTPAVSSLLAEPSSQLNYLDLGCCSGFFADGMAEIGFRSYGVDVGSHFIEWGNRLARIKGRAINYIKSDAHKFIVETEDCFDVTSTFATIQWVMVQKDYETGVECFKQFFKKTKHIAIVEMGYTTEEIYRGKIDGCPGAIDKDWVLELMNAHGDFASIEVHHAGENGIWRDIFVGFREVPTDRIFRRAFESEMVAHVSDASGYSDDGWVAPSFEVYLKAIKPIKSIRFNGWRPEDSKFVDSKISISLGRENKGQYLTKAGLFEFEQEVDISQDQVFCLKLNCSTVEETPGDDRKLSFVLQNATFS